MKNSTLVEHLRQADGRYFNDTELKSLESYVSTYALRLKTYSILCEKSEAIVRQAVQKLAVADGQTVQQQADLCVRDMSYVLRTVAVAVLKDDNEGFRQYFVLWMQNIMASLKKEAQSVRAYRYLQEVVKAQMPAECAKLVNDNLEVFISSMIRM